MVKKSIGYMEVLNSKVIYSPVTYDGFDIKPVILFSKEELKEKYLEKGWRLSEIIYRDVLKKLDEKDEISKQIRSKIKTDISQVVKEATLHNFINATLSRIVSSVEFMDKEEYKMKAVGIDKLTKYFCQFIVDWVDAGEPGIEETKKFLNDNKN